MPVEAKPLFRPEVVRPHLAGVHLPDEARAVVAKWAEMLASGRADKFTERELLANFLADFGGVLGYTRPVDSGKPLDDLAGEARPDRWQVRRRRAR